MTHTTQVLSDDKMWILWNAQGSDEMNKDEAIAFARAIESATLKAVSGKEPITVEAVAEVVDRHDGEGARLDWMVEGGLDSLPTGVVLLVSHRPITDTDGHGEVYTLPPAQPAPVDDEVIAGVLFDFMGWLTSRKQRIVLSSSDNASPAVNAIEEFAKMRGIDISNAAVLDWQARAALQCAQAPQPTKGQP